MAKKQKNGEAGPSKGIGKTSAGHPTLDGALWHVPKVGSPTECETPGCEKVLGAWRTLDPLEALDDESGEDTEVAA